MQQMSLEIWVKGVCSITVETAGCQKMPQWKAILLSLWKVRVLRRFLDKLQQMSMGGWVKAFWKLSALKKMPWWKGILLSLWKVRVLRRFLDKMQQMSAGSWVKAFCSISVESAGSQKIP